MSETVVVVDVKIPFWSMVILLVSGRSRRYRP